MGNFWEERDQAAARNAGGREADEAAMAAIHSGRYDPEQLREWAQRAAEGLHGAAADDADRAFAAGFAEHALSTAAEYAKTGAELAACYRQPGSPHPDLQLAARGWHVGECGVYTRARAQAAAETSELEPAELEAG
jgi:hypothetical protein